ncbi:MAG: PQQ-binding-like beta-propeller repeat protein [Pirellulales bacterium]
MKESWIEKGIPAAVAAAGAVVIAAWFLVGRVGELDLRKPGADGPPPVQTAKKAPPGKVEGKLTKSTGVAANLPGTWPRFRGPDLSAIYPKPDMLHPAPTDPAPASLARQWGAAGPKVLWSIDVGDGHAGAAILAGRVYVMDYDVKGRADALRCLSLGDGKEIWRYSYPNDVEWDHGMSRTVPYVDAKHVIAIGPNAHVVCLDSTTGQFRWMRNLVADFHATVPAWYVGQNPLVDRDRLILATGGDALLVALDCATGKLVWKSPNPRKWTMTHSSITPMDFKGRRMYVYCGSGGVAGVSADDGQILWDTTEWKIKLATVPSPVVIGEGRVFLCGGYNAGAMILDIKESAGKLTASPAVRLKPDVFGSTQQTPILWESHLYGVREKDKQLVCLDLAGKELWSSGSGKRFGSGPYMMADGLLLVMNDTGVLTLGEVSPAGFKQLAQAKVIDRARDSWGPMALAGTRLIVRDLTRMVCLELGTR